MCGSSSPRLPAASGPARAGQWLTILFLFSPSPLKAHDATAGWAYPQACCHGDMTTGECQSIPSRTVRGNGRGWVVVLDPGDHRKVTRRQRYFIPYGDEIPSRDGDYHICLHPGEEHENCFFVPPDTM